MFKEATEQGIPVATYAWGYVTGPGENYSTVVGEDTCALGEAFAEIMNEQVGPGKIALLGGSPGNPLSAGWQKCEKPALNPEIKVVGTDDTNWVPSKVQEVVASLLAKHPDLKGISYEYSGGMALGAFPAIKAAGIPIDRSGRCGPTSPCSAAWSNEARTNPNLKIYYATPRELADPASLTAGMMKLKGATIPPQIVFPIELQNQSVESLCVPGRPQEASINSLIPDELCSSRCIRRVERSHSEPDLEHRLEPMSTIPGPRAPSCCRCAASPRRSARCRRCAR